MQWRSISISRARASRGPGERAARRLTSFIAGLAISPRSRCPRHKILKQCDLQQNPSGPFVFVVSGLRLIKRFARGEPCRNVTLEKAILRCRRLALGVWE